MELNSSDHPWIEFIIRILRAIVIILGKWPEGESPTPAQLLVLLFGEDWAARFETILRTITGIPELVDYIEGLLRIGEPIFVVALFGYGFFYWKSYSDVQKDAAKSDAVDEDLTNMLPPHKWVFQRLLPVMFVGVVIFEIFKYMLKLGWGALTFFVELIYTGSGSSMGETFEALFYEIAGVEGMGIPFFLILLVVMLIVTAYFLVRFLDWVFHFMLAFIVGMVDWAKLLKGDRRTSFAEAFLVFGEQLARVGSASFLLSIAPLVALAIQSWSGNVLVGFFVMTSFLYWSVKVPSMFFGWRTFADRWAKAGSWIDEGVVPAPHPERLQGLLGWAWGKVMSRVPDSYKQVYSTAWELAKLDPRVAAAAAGMATLKSARSNPRLAAQTIQRTTDRMITTASTIVGTESRKQPAFKPQPPFPGPSHSSSRTGVLANTVANTEQLAAQLLGGYFKPSSRRELALLFKLASHFHSGPPPEPIGTLRERFLGQIDGMSKEEVDRLAMLGKQIGRDAFLKMGRLIDPEWM